MKKKLVALFAATALVATGPVAAQSSIAHEPVRSGAEMEDSNDIRGGFIIPTVVVVGLILLVLALTDTWPFDEDPVSP